MTSAHPASILGLAAIESSRGLPGLPTVTLAPNHQLLFNGKPWLVFPAVIGVRTAPDNIDHERYAPGAQLPGTLFLPKFFNGDEEKHPTGQLVFNPSVVLEAWLLKIRADVIRVVATNKGPLIIGKATHHKAFSKLTTDAEKIAFVTELSDLEDNPYINFTLRKDTKISTDTNAVHKVSCKLNIFKEGKGEPAPEWGPDVATWLEKSPADKVDAPNPVDANGIRVPWATLRANKPDVVPLNFTGFIRELGISANPPNANAGGKIFFSSFFIKSLQIISYEASSEESSEPEDVSRFFDLEPKEEKHAEEEPPLKRAKAEEHE
jgi:hypothetical protein